ncbi:hypothetical protein LTS18_014905 [Coniosporium uncinatum]|uniref:Uncharacterized protein n=1 Tax=Coniosporium uncinatum TaxID=93489 RepID=A0ACC3D8R8_9PEZI|nr:hypothetical protein LTS18_014905 [Coniosporium uncinatum]
MALHNRGLGHYSCLLPKNHSPALRKNDDETDDDSHERQRVQEKASQLDFARGTEFPIAGIETVIEKAYPFEIHPEPYRSWVVSTLKTSPRYRSPASGSVALEKTKAWEAVRAWMHLRKAYLDPEELEFSIERENREGIQTQTIEQELQAKSIYALRVVKRELQTTKDEKELSREA